MSSPAGGTGALVFDTSALLVYLNNERDPQQVEQLLLDVKTGQVFGYITFAALLEIEIFTLRNPAPANTTQAALFQLRTDILTQGFGLRVQDETPWLRSRAAHFKSLGGISVLDAYALALGEKMGEPLVHRDQEFTSFAAAGKAPRVRFLAI